MGEGKQTFSGKIRFHLKGLWLWGILGPVKMCTEPPAVRGGGRRKGRESKSSRSLSTTRGGDGAEGLGGNPLEEGKRHIQHR